MYHMIQIFDESIGELSSRKFDIQNIIKTVTSATLIIAMLGMKNFDKSSYFIEISVLAKLAKILPHKNMPFYSSVKSNIA